MGKRTRETLPLIDDTADRQADRDGRLPPIQSPARLDGAAREDLVDGVIDKSC